MRRALHVLVALLATACDAGTPSPEAASHPSTDGVADSVMRNMHELLEAVGARDSARVLGYFAGDSAMRLIEGGIMTRADLAGMAGAFYRSMASIESSLEGPLHVAILGPEAAVASGRYHDVFVDTGGTRTEARGIGTWVWSRRGGRWQIIHQHATPDAGSRGQ